MFPDGSSSGEPHALMDRHRVCTGGCILCWGQCVQRAPRVTAADSRERGGAWVHPNLEGAVCAFHLESQSKVKAKATAQRRSHLKELRAGCGHG